jgi:hypothetical protein
MTKSMLLRRAAVTAVAMSLTWDTALAQAFYLSASTSGTANVSPSPGSSNFYNSPSESDPSALAINRTLQASGAASYTANGIAAVGSANSASLASASLFGLQVSGSSSSIYPAILPNSALGSQFFGYSANAYADAGSSLYILDLVISGPASATTLGINLVAGNMLNASFNTGVYLGNFFPFLQDGPQSSTASGPFSSGSWVVPVGSPIYFHVTLNGYAGATSRYGEEYATSFEGSVYLPTDGPIFNLPPGYTANSVSAQIVDNRFTAVPEPSEYAGVAGLALAAFVLRRRMKS